MGSYSVVDLFCGIGGLTHGFINEKFKVMAGYDIDPSCEYAYEVNKSSNLARLGIIVDADEDIEARWQDLSQCIIQTGQVDFPQQPKASGTIIEVDQGYRKIKVGLWLMPNNKLSGMLEDFIKFLIPTEDKLWPHAEACLAQIPDADFPFDITSRNKEAWQRKAKIHTWLAWQKEPGKPLGQAITKRFVDAQAQEAQDLITWLKQLLQMD